MRTWLLRPLAGATCALALAACAERTPIGPADAAARISPVASADLDTLWVEETLQLTWELENPAGRTLPHNKHTTWRSTRPEVAAVDATGLVTAVDTGTALVIARHVTRAEDTVTIVVRYPPEGRALWVNRFEYSSAAKIADIIKSAADANFNVVYFQVRGQGDAYYKSDLEPCAVGLCGSLGNGYPPYDPLAVAVAEAHARGLELHAWVNALTGWASPTSGNAAFCALLRDSRPGFPKHMLRAHPEWAMLSSARVAMTCQNSQAFEYAYVSPGIPAVRTHLARVAADIVRRYAVDGVHLDRIRYPSAFMSYDSVSLRLFGRTPRSSTSDPEWNQFRRDQVSLAVREVYDSITAVRPTVALSAAVWPIYVDRWQWNSSQGYGQYWQDPRAWAEGGYFDVAAPMMYPATKASTSYTIKPARCSFTDWACLLDDHVARIQDTARRHVYAGVGANRGAEEVARQVGYAREGGAAGVSIYSYNAVVSENLWPALKAGVFAKKASVPLMPWKYGAPALAAARPTRASLLLSLFGAPTDPPSDAIEETAVEPAKENGEEPNVPDGEG